jgi:hypothetical protein
MATDIHKTSKLKSIFNNGLAKAAIIVAILLWLVSKCGSDSKTATEFEIKPSPTSSYLEDSETSDEKFNRYVAYFSFCYKSDEVYMYEQDLKLLKKDLLAPEDFKEYLLALGRHGIEVQGEAESTIEEFGFHEDEELATQFGKFGEQVLQFRMNIGALNYDQLSQILENYKTLTSKTDPICENLKPF